MFNGPAPFIHLFLNYPRRPTALLCIRERPREAQPGGGGSRQGAVSWIETAALSPSPVPTPLRP